MLSQRTSSRVLAVTKYVRWSSNNSNTPERHGLYKQLRELAEDPNYSEEKFASTVIHGRAAFPPHYHPRTHGIPVALLHFRSFEPRLLDLFLHFTTHAASALAIPISRPVYLPTQRSLWTVIKGPFVNKKTQENFERKVHKRLIKAWDADQEVVDRWVKYLRRHALGGVAMRVTQWERAPVGIGERLLRDVSHSMQSPTHAAQVKTLGEKITQQELINLVDEASLQKP